MIDGRHLRSDEMKCVIIINYTSCGRNKKIEVGQGVPTDDRLRLIISLVDMYQLKADILEWLQGQSIWEEKSPTVFVHTFFLSLAI